MAILLANRRLPMSEAHQLIDDALRTAYPDEYQRAIETLARFNKASE